MPKSMYTMDALTEWQKQDEELGTTPPDANMVTVQRESYKVPGLPEEDPNQETSAEKSKRLRGHHFSLGLHDVSKESNMKATFKHPGAPLSETSGNAEGGAKMDEVMRANFNFGSDENPEQYVSVQTAEISRPARIKPLPAVKIDSGQFRQHNVVLGSDKPAYCTQTEDTYVDHGGQGMGTVEERDAKRAQMRLASFSFGSFNPTFTSTARDSYTEQPIHKELCAGATPREVLERVNYTFGSDFNERRSEAKDAFGREQALKDQCSNREVPDKNKKKALNQAHFALGHDETSYGTVGSESYTTPEVKKEDGAESARDRAIMLRRSNVTLGCDNVPKISSARSAHPPPPPDCEAFLPMTDRRKHGLDGVHFEHGHDTAELRAERSKPFSHHAAQTGIKNVNYSRLTGLGDEPVWKTYLKKSSVLMGHMPPTNISTHAHGYQEYPGFQPSRISEATKQELRKASFSFGNDDVYTKDLSTVQRECFGDQKPSMNPGDIETYSLHGKSSAVLLGGHGLDYGTEHKGAYVDPAVASPPAKKNRPVYHGHEEITSEKQQQFRWPDRPRLSAAGQSVIVRP